jgi:hypothetical protein
MDKLGKNQEVSNSWGVTSLVVGILGLILFVMPYIGLPMSIMAIVGAYKQNKIKPLGMATAGNVLGIIGCVLNGVMLLFVGLVVLAAMAI